MQRTKHVCGQTSCAPSRICPCVYLGRARIEGNGQTNLVRAVTAELPPEPNDEQRVHADTVRLRGVTHHHVRRRAGFRLA